MVNIGGMTTKFIMGMVGVVLLVTMLGAVIGTVATAGDTVNATGYSGASLFASNGILPMLVIFGVLVAVIGLAFVNFKKN